MAQGGVTKVRNVTDLCTPLRATCLFGHELRQEKNEFMDPELRERGKIAPKPVLQADLGEVLHLEE